ncbi:putative HTH-type transcriptional regulator [Clostridium phage HM T]|uniref:Putative HTH-type transcriptional regulator n=1 Tax=Clostridium saccharoperbutylacetonicum N1-4(HMT) TaxID=931276 RepID=M1MT88_9CLOT|nr:helix-turn-helix transcriptional regulator [Clostridium saccharoperbutylacetonicum]AMB17420.1 putative HTH-type transcriptional regulator [Clostridium phage HM T]AGF54772.1 putative HTH-type transcriptional regulator [Clostridium saccharoperbutylacetonicum N1-4(HMT)]NRT58707.1 putative transcriptional regulator [Clostridium saccharoperbutylacetonicum]NSB27896.1 putative transcriptional regulator [Clostridium saccharoperbutylacetonicum]NSB41379.1 putative transcriptional regulator [Clostridi
MNNKLLEFRNQNELTQKEIAKVIHKTTSFYGMLEKGKRKPSIEVAYSLARFYNTTIEEIFFKNENNLKLI